MPADFDAYFRALAARAANDKTEHTDRAALEALLQAAADDAEPGGEVIHEARGDRDAGRPDFKVRRQGRIVGYVEVKTIDENLSKVLKSEQIGRYKKLSDNIVLTDYLEFCWIKAGGEVVRERLAHSEDLTARKLALKPERVAAVRLLLRGFFSATPQRISRSQDLALALASRAAMLRDFLSVELQRQAKEHREGRLYALYDVFRRQVFHDLGVGDFADAFAQMLAYGLFLARLNAGETVMVTLGNVRQHIPGSFSLIRELVRFLEEMDELEYRGVRWVVEEVLSIVNGIDLAAIHNDLSFRARKAVNRKVRAGDEEEHRLFERDPFVYFYEDFLKAYDPAMRKGRGVYYTPPPVVNFIVRAVDDLLKDRFGIREGLADHNKVTVLDFACGTGTFLLEVFERIFDNIGGADAGRADQMVREHLTKNIYGFEYLIAPYTIAHLKLSQYLKDKGHPLEGEERLQVFLTNTLEPIEPQRDLMLPALSHEVEAAQAVKDRPILVITGNPPYSGHSKNKGAWITAAIDAYKFTVETDDTGKKIEKSLGEKNPKWLNDDYVKFIRFAQMKIDAVDEGVVGIITNHSWLDNPTFRGMRQSLTRTFDQIFILDLHGSTKPKEEAPLGAANENVFDIQKGVSVTLFVKKRGLEKGIWFSELWGTRLEKYRTSARAQINYINWELIPCFEPYFMCRPLDWTGWDNYAKGWQLADVLHADGQKAQIFDVSVLGFQTHRDAFAISFAKSEMLDKLSSLADLVKTDDELLRQYGLKSAGEWDLPSTRREIRRAFPDVIKVAYRPFDERWSEFSSLTMDRPRQELLDHVSHRDNLTILVPRQIGTAEWCHASVASIPAESCYIASDTKSQNYVFPLSLNNGLENLTSEFRKFIDTLYSHHYSPEEIFGYIYAALHAPTYRRRYAEFLRIDFPRIPFSESRAQFDALSRLGWELVQAHLLRKVPTPPGERLGVYHGKGDHVVEAVRYSPQEEAVWINKTQRFSPVPQAVWDFHIGGYQVLDKYLKSRRGRTLTLDETTHVGQVAEALAFTIAQMDRIDEAYRAAFPDGG